MKQVITANTLKTGEVVFLGAEGWVSSLEDAVLYEQDENLDEMIALHQAPDHVMGLYAIDVEVKQGVVVAHHIREKIRYWVRGIMTISVWAIHRPWCLKNNIHLREALYVSIR